MRIAAFFLYAAIRSLSEWRERRRSLSSHIKRLRASGYTKTVFDCDGHTVVIQSHKHVEENSA